LDIEKFTDPGDIGVEDSGGFKLADATFKTGIAFQKMDTAFSRKRYIIVIQAESVESEEVREFCPRVPSSTISGS
jgi:hypothetical protein